MSRNMLDANSHKVRTALSSNIIVLFFHVNEKHNNVERRKKFVDLRDSLSDLSLVLVRVEIGGNEKTMERHVRTMDDVAL